MAVPFPPCINAGSDQWQVQEHRAQGSRQRARGAHVRRGVPHRQVRRDVRATGGDRWRGRGALQDYERRGLRETCPL